MNTQYLYINSKNRLSTDNPCRFTVKIPNNYIRCSDINQVIKMTCINFSMPISWYFINLSNNTFILNNGIDNVLNISPGNYTFKNLAFEIQRLLQLINPLITVIFNPNSIKLIFTFPNINFSLKFGSASLILGFNINSINIPNGLFQITSLNVLETILTDVITLNIDNASIFGNPNMTNNVIGDNNLYISNSILSIPNNFSPGDIAVFENGNDLFNTKIKDKFLDSITFSIRDQDANLMTYVTDWSASIKVDFIEPDLTNDGIVNSITSMTEYLKLMFIQNGLK